MSWGLVAVGGATLLGGVVASQGARSAASSQANAAQQGIDSQERMFQQGLDLQEPYREAGYGALTGLQSLTTPGGRAQSLEDYYSGAEYQAIAEQQEGQVLRNASATGRLRSGGSEAALASIGPQLGQNYLSDQYNQLTGLANLGMGAASQGAMSANNLGTNIANLQGQAGQAQAGNQLAQANILSNSIGTLGGLGQDYFNRPPPII